MGRTHPSRHRDATRNCIRAAKLSSYLLVSLKDERDKITHQQAYIHAYTEHIPRRTVCTRPSQGNGSRTRVSIPKREVHGEPWLDSSQELLAIKYEHAFVYINRFYSRFQLLLLRFSFSRTGTVLRVLVSASVEPSIHALAVHGEILQSKRGMRKMEKRG